ncbi:MAG: ATP-grasp domain-containing protein, partial [Tumebacillaceae bacterium]
RLHQEKPFRAIIALEETEIVRAGRLRTRLGLRGQSEESAVAFRNKVQMKTIAKAGGVPVSAFAKLETPLDLYDFVQEHGFPVVVKPQAGMFSINTAILHNDAELLEWLKTGSYNDMMMEAYVPGDLYHVDGIVVEGELRFISACAYVNTCLSFTEAKGFGSIILSPSHPIGQRVIEFVKHLLNVLPTPETTTFHCEVFHTPDDNLMLCEIASRTAGGKAPDLFERAFGVEFNRYIARAQVGLIDPVPEFTSETELIGMFYIPPQRGVLKSMPEDTPFEWCEYYDKTGEIGKNYNGPQGSTANYAIVAARGKTDAEVTERLMQLIAYVENNTVWEM